MRSCLTATLVATSLLLSLPGQAEIYKTVDEHGNVTFTDSAPDRKSEPVELPPANTMPAVKRPEQSPQDAPDADEEAIKYSHLSIVSPADESAIEHGPGDFTVTISVKPELAKGHALQLLMDGKPYGRATRAKAVQLTNVFRGTHQLQVKIIDEAGKTLKKSKSSSVHVFRPSVLLPGYRN